MGVCGAASLRVVFGVAKRNVGWGRYRAQRPGAGPSRLNTQLRLKVRAALTPTRHGIREVAMNYGSAPHPVASLVQSRVRLKVHRLTGPGLTVG